MPTAGTVQASLVEQVGETAGKIWAYLSEKGEVKTSDLIREIGEPRDLTQRAVGWLAREGKVHIVKVGNSERIWLK